MVVWDVLTALDRWPSWNSDVKSMSMHGAVGLVARLFHRPVQKALDSGLENGLRYLKAEVERRATR